MSNVKMRRMSRRNRRAGFTLLELLLVMAILVILASLSTVAVLNLQASSQSKAAFAQINVLKQACKMYQINGGTPRSLDDLIIMPAGMNSASWGGPYLEDDKIPLDPWQSKYSFSIANEKITITSNGKDGQRGTTDDIPGVGS